MRDEQMWLWMVAGGEHVSVPFDTREQALEDARDHFFADEEPTILLGHPRWPDPGDYVPRGDVEDMLQRMDEAAFDDGIGPDDDELFVLKQKDGAAEALERALVQWARQWCTATQYSFEEVERVKLSTGLRPRAGA